MKKVGILLLCLMLILPISVNAAKSNSKDTTKEEEKEDNVDTSKLVKVYVFVAGGCGYCEQQLAYLESLDSYNKKFTIVEKELFVDNQTWAHGADYELGETVANGFNKAGFKNANVSGTPFVVISDLYAATTYSGNLESVINEAYEAGDKDIVSCYAEGRTDCLPEPDTKISRKALIIAGVCSVVLAGALIGAGIIISKKQD